MELADGYWQLAIKETSPNTRTRLSSNCSEGPLSGVGVVPGNFLFHLMFFPAAYFLTGEEFGVVAGGSLRHRHCAKAHVVVSTGSAREFSKQFLGELSVLCNRFHRSSFPELITPLKRPHLCLLTWLGIGRPKSNRAPCRGRIAAGGPFPPPRPNAGTLRRIGGSHRLWPFPHSNSGFQYRLFNPQSECRFRPVPYSSPSFSRLVLLLFGLRLWRHNAGAPL